jgi:hypothetical protein
MNTSAINAQSSTPENRRYRCDRRVAEIAEIDGAEAQITAIPAMSAFSAISSDAYNVCIHRCPN